MSATLARSLALRESLCQSSARPSLCSDVPPLEQNREMPHDEPPQVLIRAFSSAVVPGLADGVQVFDAGLRQAAFDLRDEADGTLDALGQLLQGDFLAFAQIADDLCQWCRLGAVHAGPDG